ncbi:MAG: hypothetical protein U0800_02985 [Isosphaeraceae bacterium]
MSEANRSRWASSSARFRSRVNQAQPISRQSSDVITAPARAAGAGRRRTHFASRSQAGTGLAAIGRPSSQLFRSSARSSARGYRRAGSFSRHLRQIVSRSRGISARTVRGRGGAASVTCWIRRSRPLASNAGRRVSSSYSTSPRA